MPLEVVKGCRDVVLEDMDQGHSRDGMGLDSIVLKSSPTLVILFRDMVRMG